MKGGPTRFPIVFNTEQQKLLKQFENDFHFISKDQTEDMLLFTPLNYKTKPLIRENFDKELHSILKQVFVLVQKHIRIQTV